MIKTLQSIKKNFYLKVFTLAFSYVFVGYKIITHNSFDQISSAIDIYVWDKKVVLLFVLVFYLMFINWGLEALKWKTLVKSFAPCTYNQAHKTIFSGISYGMFFSRGIGSLMAKLSSLPKEKFAIGTLASGIGAFFQGLVTLIFGLMGLFFFQVDISSSIDNITIIEVLIITCTFIASFVLMVLFNGERLKGRIRKIDILGKLGFKKHILISPGFEKKSLYKVGLYSFLRYCVFSFQYSLILSFFVPNIPFNQVLTAVTVIYLIMSFVPSFFAGGLGIRGSVSLFVFSFLTSNTLGLIMASFIIWLVNIVFPALIAFGLTFLKSGLQEKNFKLEHVK